MNAVLFAVLGAILAQSPLLKDIEASFVQLHEQMGPCVVNIDTEGSVFGDSGEMEFFRRFFNMPGDPEEKQESPAPHPMFKPRGQGSGFIFDKTGHIVTNNHVVENADTITVKLWNGKEYPAVVAGTDPESDLAVIKIEPEEELTVARLGDSDALNVGQFVMAIGSARGFEGSTSFGHISAVGREGLRGLAMQGLTFQNLIQTDAAINLGNSGGPLCNIAGEVIGVNTAIVWNANSIGFAIPINTVKNTVPQLISGGKVTRGYLGVAIDDAREFAEAVGLPDKAGAIVKRVQPGTPAESAKIQVYDVLRKIDGEAVEGAEDLVRRISSFAPGSSITLEVWRDEKAIEVPVQLHERQLYAVQPDREQYILGMRIRPVTSELLDKMGLSSDMEGVLVTGIKPDSPAVDAKLMDGDIILEVARQRVKNPGELLEALKLHGAPGKSLLVQFVRGKNEPDITTIRIPK
ncbi:MAG TPA: trypsin-like peptidase domain-containing protein [Candidatus Hydrogenedentes bacterium]|nr:trypsin-like peptidase domain-containing protein [Candidatus Hydrogenedentota bacterium]